MAEAKTKAKTVDTAKIKQERKAQAVGNVHLNKRKEFTINQDTKHFSKGDKVELNEPTEALFKAKGII